MSERKQITKDHQTGQAAETAQQEVRSLVFTKEKNNENSQQIWHWDQVFYLCERLWHFRGSSSLLETGGDFVMAEVLSYRLSAGNTTKDFACELLTLKDC